MEKLNFNFNKRVERVKDYLSTKNAIFIEDKVNAQITFEDIIIVIDIEIGEFMSDIVIEAYFGKEYDDYENLSLRTHIYNIPNDEQGLNIIGERNEDL